MKGFVLLVLLILVSYNIVVAEPSYDSNVEDLNDTAATSKEMRVVESAFVSEGCAPGAFRIGDICELED